MKHSFFYITLILLCLTGQLFAQSMSYDQFRRQQNQQYRQYRSDKQAEYRAYRKKINEQYANMIAKQWETFHASPEIKPIKEEEVKPVVYEGEPTETEPAPQPQQQTAPQEDLSKQTTPQEQVPQENAQQPKLMPEQDVRPPLPPALPIPSKQIPIQVEVVQIPKIAPVPLPIAPIEEQPKVSGKKETVTYYGTNITLRFPEQDAFHLTSLQNKALADGWKVLADEKYEILVGSALSARDSLKLCDWAYMQVLRQICTKHYSNANDAMFALGFIMTQSGYKVRLAKQNERNLVLLFNCPYTIFNRRYYTIDGQRFLPIDNIDGAIEICPALYEKEQPLSLQIGQNQLFTEKMTDKRTLTSKKGLTLSAQVNKNTIDFYNDYPSACLGSDATTRWAAYANTPMEKNLQKTLYPTIKKNVQNLSEKDAVGLILNWVQTAFEYKLDDEVWGEDRAFFAIETLYYPYCDCEDRAILFSRIVRDVLGLDVVLLYYPGHLATAVHFNEDVKGDYLTYQNRKYVVCDPTFINAGVGRTMYGMNNKEAKVIAL